MEQNLNQDQEQMQQVAAQVKQRCLNEIPHLNHVLQIAKADHESVIAPLCGIMRSFAIFCNSDDNYEFLKDMRELFASYAYSKQNKDSIERRESKTIISTLNSRLNDIEVCKRKNQDYEFTFDFFPLFRRYEFLLIRGHRPCKEEEDICKSMINRIAAICEREIIVRKQSLETCNKLLE